MRAKQKKQKAAVIMALFIQNGAEDFKSFLRNEDGDTNFISVLTLLGIALALAAIFLVFRDQVVSWVNEQVAPFFGS